MVLAQLGELALGAVERTTRAGRLQNSVAGAASGSGDSRHSGPS